MNAIRIRTTLESETLTLPEVLPWVGKSVEIIVLEESPARSAADHEHPLRGSILRDDDPFGPAVPGSAMNETTNEEVFRRCCAPCD